MTRSRSFTVAATSAEMALDRGAGQAAFTVSNVGTTPVSGRAKVIPLRGAQDTWFSIDGPPERDFATNETQQVLVSAVIPSGTAAGEYALRLDMLSVINTEKDYTEGPTISFVVRPAAEPMRLPSWLIPVIALLIIAAVLIAWLFLKPRPEIPDVTGETFAEASAKLEAAGLRVAQEEQIQNKEPGTILEQRPKATEPWPADGIVTLVVEASLVAVPDLVGQKVDAAEDALEKLGLVLTPRSHVLTEDATKIDTISGQEPSGREETKVRKGRHVLVDILEPGVKVPNLIDQNWVNAAIPLLIEKKLLPGTPTSAGQGPNPGAVKSQTPAEGETVAINTRVDVTVQERTISVPNVVGLLYNQVAGELAKYDLGLGVVTFEPQEGFATTVKSQSPNLGATLPSGGKVNIVVTKRPFIIRQPGDVILHNPRVIDPALLEGIRRRPQ